MAIKVIHRGTTPEHEPFRGTCPNCNSLIECERSDGTPGYDPRERKEFLRLQCTVCQAPMTAYSQRVNYSDADIRRQMSSY